MYARRSPPGEAFRRAESPVSRHHRPARCGEMALTLAPPIPWKGAIRLCKGAIGPCKGAISPCKGAIGMIRHEKQAKPTALRNCSLQLDPAAIRQNGALCNGQTQSATGFLALARRGPAIERLENSSGFVR